MTTTKTKIEQLYREAQPYLEQLDNGRTGKHGFEEDASDDAHDQVADIAEQMAQTPSMSERDRRCKARVYLALAPDASSVIDSMTVEEKLVRSIIEDVNPLHD